MHDIPENPHRVFKIGFTRFVIHTKPKPRNTDKYQNLHGQVIFRSKSYK